jgi:phage terminase small subunit
MLPIHRIPEEARRGLAGVQIITLPDSSGAKKRPIGRRYKLDFSFKLKALSMLGKYLKMFPKTGVAGKRGKPWNPAEQISIEQLRYILEGSTNEIETPLKPPLPNLVGKPPSRAAMKGRGSFMGDRFCVEYLKDFNATQAAVRAGYSPKTAASQGQRLLKSPAVAAASARVLKKAEVSAERVTHELEAIAFLDPIECFDSNDHWLPIHQMPESARRALKTFEIEELYNCDCHRREETHVGLIYSLRFSNKLAALELLMKIHKML